LSLPPLWFPFVDHDLLPIDICPAYTILPQICLGKGGISSLGRNIWKKENESSLRPKVQSWENKATKREKKRRKKGGGKGGEVKEQSYFQCKSSV
jgi:hypothetical protein